MLRNYLIYDEPEQVVINRNIIAWKNNHPVFPFATTVAG
jgi:hypothetical protein